MHKVRSVWRTETRERSLQRSRGRSRTIWSSTRETCTYLPVWWLCQALSPRRLPWLLSSRNPWETKRCRWCWCGIVPSSEYTPDAQL